MKEMNRDRNENRTKEINELMSHRAIIISLRKEIEDLNIENKQTRERLEGEIKKNEQFLEEAKKLEMIEYQNLEFSKKIWHLEGKVQNLMEKLDHETKKTQAQNDNVKRLDKQISNMEEDIKQMSEDFQSLQKKYERKCSEADQEFERYNNNINFLTESSKKGLESTQTECNKLLREVNENHLKDKQELSDKLTEKHSMHMKKILDAKLDVENALLQINGVYDILKQNFETQKMAYEANTSSLTKEMSLLKSQIKEKIDLINDFAKTTMPQWNSFKCRLDEFKNDLRISDPALLERLEEENIANGNKFDKIEFKDHKHINSSNLININLTNNILTTNF
jgi:hypothetical protein